MTLVQGDTDDGGAGTGQDGHRCVVNYSVTQNIAANTSKITYSYGVDYGDPNYWANISHRDFTWSSPGAGSITAHTGGGTSQTTNTIINTSDPGYGGKTHYFGGVWSGTLTITHDSNGEAVVRLNASMEFSSGAHDSNITNHDITLPDIVQDPTAPSGVTATRVSDSQIDLSWTNNSSTHHAYASQRIQRSVDGGAYQTIASGLSATATSYSDTATSANHKYLYKVQAVNAAGSATSSVSSAVYTTPDADTDIVATKLAGGDVKITWTINSNYSASGEFQHDVYDNPDDGDSVFLATVSGPLTSYTHVAPNATQTHQYHTVAFPSGTSLFAQSDDSNVVVLLATADAPTGLSPSGVARDAADDIVLSWTHDPADGTPQSKRHVQYKVGTGAYADLVDDSSTTESYTIAGGTLTNGDVITWKVATAGENGTLGDYSAEASFTLSAKPTVTISAPDDTYDSSTLIVEWGYFQDQSSDQAAWKASLIDADASTLETLSGTDETTVTFTHVVADATSYTVSVTVTSAAGLVSDAATQTFTVTYALPAAIAITAAFDSAAGATVLTLTGDASSSGYSGLSLDGTGDYASTPDAAALDITGDIDIRLDVEMDDWTPAADTVLVAKWATDERSYEVTLTTAGMIRFSLTTDGTASTVVDATSSVAPAPVDDRLSLRIDRDSGAVTFYTSTDTDLTAATWTQLGTTQAAAGTIFASSADLQVGADGDSTAALTGTVYSVELRDADDTVVANPDFSAEDAATTSFDDDAGLTWTLAGDAEIVTVVAATEDISTVDVQRKIGSGAWITILSGVVLDDTSLTATVQDTVPATVDTNTYRAVAYSALPSSVMSSEVEATTSETTWGYLSGGDSFATVARFRAVPTYGAETSRVKALYHFAGREKPVQLAGDALTYTLSVSGSLDADAGTPSDFEALGRLAGVHCWRGPDGRRVFGSLAKINIGVARLHELPTVAFTLAEVDFAEGDQ